MNRRRYFAWIALVALSTCSLAGCEGEGDPSDSDIADRCDQLGEACGEDGEHVETIAEECKDSVESDSTCYAEALALFECYQGQICVRDDEVWGFQDLHVLSDRHEACLEQRDELDGCLDQESSSD